MNLLFPSVWREKVWQMNKSAERLLIVTTLWMAIVWRITGDLPNSPNFLPAKLSCQTFLLYGF